jgi:anti-anti-sigma regulatory factor
MLLNMNVKIDTKEKFSVITPEDSEITANMSDSLLNLLQSYQQKETPHVILNLSNVQQIVDEVLDLIVEQQQSFYQENFSFVICCLNANIIAKLEEKEYMDTMNITPSETEAWDIVQMEEIERELLNDFDDN